MLITKRGEISIIIMSLFDGNRETIPEFDRGWIKSYLKINSDVVLQGIGNKTDEEEIVVES